MTRYNFVTALGFGVFILSTIQPTAAQAQGCNPGSQDCVCADDPETGSCVKHISKTKPPVTPQDQERRELCEGYGGGTYDPQSGGCTNGHSGGGGD